MNTIILKKGSLATRMQDCPENWETLKKMLQLGWSITSDQLFRMQAG